MIKILEKQIFDRILFLVPFKFFFITSCRMSIFSSVTDGQIVLQTSKLLFLKIIIKKKMQKKREEYLVCFSC